MVWVGLVAPPYHPAMVEYELQGHVALITLNRPEARNAINRQVAQELEAAIDRLDADDEVRAGVLRAVTVGDDPRSAPART